MRKLLALLIVAAAFTFTACEKKGGEAGNADSMKMDSVAAPDQVAPPVAPADSMPAADSTKTEAPAPAAH